MDISIFTDKAVEPNLDDLKNNLDSTFDLWQQIVKIVKEQYPNPKEEWNYPGKKYGWSFRLKDKKRAIIYLLPRQGYFKVGFVFGQKASDQIMASDINSAIKEDLAAAKKYAEGRGIHILATKESLSDIKTLIEIKLAN
ncbi:DUF3788 domain-containing protein [Labilibaculum antarcticum]|jgi:hypothetical protein|uniref:YdhG-like domain-containing protein n=1 Tax=Labilibaculum antarcticum TaxID=1717717 RepID=A0A1Y1CMK8_9BACT|nr:DUF3788 domain-containing protein [Labilibaculum antarcticum]BAX81658.1 hypothetical protein ALGA_3360 [Labilibaculum antarcticum]